MGGCIVTGAARKVANATLGALRRGFGVGLRWHRAAIAAPCWVGIHQGLHAMRCLWYIVPGGMLIHRRSVFRLTDRGAGTQSLTGEQSVENRRLVFHADTRVGDLSRGLSASRKQVPTMARTIRRASSFVFSGSCGPSWPRHACYRRPGSDIWAGARK